jgi:hypothetical protein
LYIHGSPLQGGVRGGTKLLKHALNLRSGIT